MVNKLHNFNFRVNYPFNDGENATKMNKNASHSRFSGKNSIQFKFICIALFTIQIIVK